MLQIKQKSTTLRLEGPGRWQALGFAKVLEGLGYFRFWNKTEHRGAELPCMTEGEELEVVGIWGWRVRWGVGSERRGGGLQSTTLPLEASRVMLGVNVVHLTSVLHPD